MRKLLKFLTGYLVTICFNHYSLRKRFHILKKYIYNSKYSFELFLGPGPNFIPPGRTSFPMRPSMARMPQSTMYGPSGGSNQGQYMNTGASSTAGSGNTGYMQQMQQGT